MKNYFLGDTYSSDFDYDGMYRMSLELNLGWGIEKMQKLYDSFVSVGLKDKAENLINSIVEMKAGKTVEAQMYLEDFQDEIEKEFESGLDTWNQRLLKAAYEDVNKVCRENGLILREDFSISDNGIKFYEPEIMGLHEDGNYQDTSIYYYADDGSVLGNIYFDMENRVFTIDFEDWEVEDMDYYSSAKYRTGGGVKDRGIRPSPKESATIYKVGTKKRGQDGNMWVVVEASNGVKRWKKTNASKEDTSPKQQEDTPQEDITTYSWQKKHGTKEISPSWTMSLKPKEIKILHKNAYLLVEPDTKANKTYIYFSKYNSEAKTLIKEINKAEFASEEEFLNELRPVLIKVKSIISYEEGGEIDESGNLYMLKNQAKEFKHHAEELDEALDKNPKVHAWVVAKAERASSDLSDITHYLDGLPSKKEQGGDILDEDTVARIDDTQLADAAAYYKGGKIRPASYIKSLYRRKLNAVKKMSQYDVIDMLNKTSLIVKNDRSKRLSYGDYVPEMREYLALVLFDAELSPEEKEAYFMQGGYVKEKSATFMDKVRAISQRLEGTKVPVKYIKEYGKFYDKEESGLAARKIAGKMVSKSKK
jgi:hypothetical protein